jgi:hypothetical protein
MHAISLIIRTGGPYGSLRKSSKQLLLTLPAWTCLLSLTTVLAGC